MTLQDDRVHREVFILESRISRARLDCEHLLNAIRSCHGAMKLLVGDNTTKDGMASAPPPSDADPFGPDLSKDYD